jgi:hypothetical protein
MSLTALLICVTLALPEDPPSNQVDRIAIGEGVTLFIPPTFQARDGRVNVVLHLHGAASVVEPALAAEWDAVLVAFNRKGLSSVYTKPFSDPALFPQLLDDALKQTAARRPNERLVLGKVMVSSFSAGFGGVRELLKVPANRDRIDAIVMADSIYCGYTGDPAAKQVDPALMAGFVAFAKEAAAGRKQMLVTHSAQVPDGYAGTTETADVLIAATGAKAEPRDLDWGDGWRQTRQAARGRFEVLGFAGAGPDDHMRHLRRIADLWKRVPRPFDGAS